VSGGSLISIKAESNLTVKLKRERAMDPIERLRKMMKETGEVNSVYGGFEIKVVEPDHFPWYKLINELIRIGQRVWVEKKEGKIYITSEPRIQ
jgi:hypothetical protein